MDIDRVIKKSIDKIVLNIINRKDFVGAILFGSSVRDNVENIGDLDIALIYNAPPSTYPSNLKKNIDDIQVDIRMYPLKYFVDVFESSKCRDSSDTWFKTSLWIELMRNGIIISDKNNVLKKYKYMALKWRWRRSEIDPLICKGCSNLDIAEREIDVFRKVLALRDATYIYAISYIMSRNLVPSFRPKDIVTKVRLIKNRDLKDIFYRIQGIESLDKVDLSRVVNSVDKFISQYNSRGALVELRNAKKSLCKDDLESCMLSLRNSIKYLSYKLIYRRFNYDFFNASSHLKMIDMLRQRYSKVYRFYKNIHLYGYREIDMDSIIKKLRQKFLQNIQKIR